MTLILAILVAVSIGATVRAIAIDGYRRVPTRAPGDGREPPR